MYAFRPTPYQPSREALGYYEKGTDFLRLGAYHQASKSLEKAISTDPDFALAHARLAEAWKELDYSDKAKDEMLRVNDLVRNHSALTKLDELYLAAINATVTNDFSKAIGYYEQIAKASPDKPDVYVDLGRAYEKNEQVDLAIDSYLKATNRDSQYPLAYLRAAAMYIRRRDVASASSALSKAENIYDALGNIEGQTEVLFYRGVLSTDTAKLEEAQTALRQALDLATTTGNARQKFSATLQMSRVAFNKGDNVKAREYANNARSMAEQQGLGNLVIVALLDLANTYNGWNEYIKAEEISQRALELSQNNRALSLRSAEQAQSGYRVNADTSSRRGVSTNPTSS